MDVARVAGVSHQTVSRVINNHASVRPATREKVLAALAETGYRRNAAARALVTRRSQTIGVLMQGGTGFGPVSTLLAVEAAAREAGYFVSLATVADWSGDEVDAAFEHFMGQAVDGLVLLSPVRAAVEATRAAHDIAPTVVVASGEHPSPGVQVASVDQAWGARLATRHLLELGHRDVMHIAGPDDWFDAARRIDGWLEERTAWGLPAAEPVHGDWTTETGFALGRRLVDEGRTPTAIFAANDQLALGLMRAFEDQGLRVPEDVSIVGFDDIEGSRFFGPPLTTVNQPFDEVGRQCIEQLTVEAASWADRSVAPAPLAPIPPTLVVRGSTAPPRSGA